MAPPDNVLTSSRLVLLSLSHYLISPERRVFFLGFPAVPFYGGEALPDPLRDVDRHGIAQLPVSWAVRLGVREGCGVPLVVDEFEFLSFLCPVVGEPL